MNTQTFEDYLSDQHADQYSGLDDCMPDDFNAWLAQLDADEWLEYGEKHAALAKQEAYRDCAKETFEVVQRMEKFADVMSDEDYEYMKTLNAHLKSKFLKDKTNE